MQRIVDRLLELAALEARAPGEFQRVDLREITEQALAAVRGLAEQRRVAVTFAASSAAAMVRGDRFLLGQGIGNLVQNAIEFTPEGGTVRLAVDAKEREVELVVDDTGPGVPAYALERVFERFYSLPRPDSGRKSSGLGLSIVREIARLHGGEVWLENQTEGGARAVWRLPVASGERSK